MSDKEIWANIPSHPGYQASSHGRVRSIDRVVFSVRRTGRVAVSLRGKILKPRQGVKSKYHAIYIGARHTDYVHRLVLIAFVGECPPGMECAHDDGNRTNNRLDNLAWKTRQANCDDRYRHGTVNYGPDNPGWAGETCLRGHAFTEKNTRMRKHGGAATRICRTCAREHIRATRKTPPDRYRDGYDEKLQEGLGLMKAGVRAIHAAQAVGIGRAALGRAWKAQGNKPYARR